MKLERILKNEEELKHFAKEILEKILLEFKRYSSFPTLLLSGELGAGKTTFTRNLVNAAGGDQNFSSPSYGLYNQYILPNLEIAHFDLYRIKDESEFENLDFFPIWENPNVLSIIEWWEIAKEKIPKEKIFVKIEVLDETTRNYLVHS